MFRKIIFSLLLILVIPLFSDSVSAATEFIIDSRVSYRFNQSGMTEVTHRVRLENVMSDLYATSYTLSLENINPIKPRATQDGRQLKLEEKKNGNTVLLTVSFEDALVGKGNSRTFEIHFEEESFANRTGEVWEISIPRLGEETSFRNYEAKLFIPPEFGKEAYISPKPTKLESSSGILVYTFEKNSMTKTGITAGFGEFQVFSFVLNYHLENPLNRTSEIAIAIPPDTAFQKIYYQTINPAPTDVEIDDDGNWLAIYRLAPRERLDIQASGSVQIFASHRPFLKPSQETLEANLQESEYWQIDDAQIRDLAQRFTTPRAIYDFVADNLTYDYDRVRPNVSRMGAKAALENPNRAICMEFTDLFVAIARASGIPAREINGFAYTENPEIQPLSLVADVLHAWPEYWDKDRMAWIPVDPTWASTTGGVDYFNKLDLRHFTFVIHGKDSIKPYPPGSYKLGPNPQKDVFVNFGQLPENRYSSPKINAASRSSLPFTSSKIAITISNPGPGALYNLSPIVNFDGSSVGGESFEILPPYANYEFTISVPFSFLGRTTPDKVTVLVADQELVLPTFKNQVVVLNLLVLFAVFVIITIFVILRVKKVSLINFIAKVKLFRKKADENNITQPTTPDKQETEKTS